MTSLAPEQKKKLQRAIARRDEIRSTEIFRYVDAAGDDLPGLFVDRYGAVIRIEVTLEAWGKTLGEVQSTIVEALNEQPGFQPDHIFHLQRWKRGKASVQCTHGKPIFGVVAQENGMRFWVRPGEDDAAGAGIFADFRIGRAFLRANARGGPSLNLFAHAGASGVAAFTGGATRIDHVDMSRKCATWAATNLALNGAFPRRHRYIVDDAVVFLQKAARRGPTYQTICCDPPTTALRPSGKRMVARNILPNLAQRCFEALLPGGALLFACNDRTISQSEILDALRDAEKSTGRKVEILKPLALGPDFRAKKQSASTRGALVKLQH